MNTPPSPTKTCKMCGMEIPQKARKCPYCHQFQNRWTLIAYHPAFAGFLAVLPLAFLLIGFNLLFNPGESYETYKDQIHVADTQIVFGDTKSGATVAVMGTITNASQVSWKEVQFHVDFFDAAGKRADVGEREDYLYGLPAGETSAFKLSFRREFPETNYVTAVVRVVGAKDARARF